MYDILKKELYKNYSGIFENDLSILTWGTASVRVPNENLFVMVPSGVPLNELSFKDMVVLDFNLNIIDGVLSPSVDAPMHSEIYKKVNNIGSIVHTHSTWATAFAQAEKNIRILGTTAADTFESTVKNIQDITNIPYNYEKTIGKLVVNLINEENIKNHVVNAVLLRKHGTLCFGDTPRKALENAIALEEVAKMNFLTEVLNPDVSELNPLIEEKHFNRKHGNNSYYGQEKK